MLFPGEVITDGAVAALRQAAALGFVAGASDPTLHFLTVVDEARAGGVGVNA